MRKLIFVVILAFLSQVGFAQAVQDNAVIPISVTLNSILRLNVTSGGNIQFVFNTMAQYNGGIGVSESTTTAFTVSSSRAYHVNIGAEDPNLLGVEYGGDLGLDVIEWVGTATAGNVGAITTAGANPLLNRTANDEFCNSAGATGDNPDSYTIGWSAGQTVSVANNAPDVYVTNVYLSLIPD